MYRDTLEMNTQLCVLLNKAVVQEKKCLSVLLHTRDCLSVLLSFLNPQLYCELLSKPAKARFSLLHFSDTYLPQLVYLRNKLWNEVFGLVSVLVANQTESADVIANCISENYKEPFLQALCEAISNHHSEGT